MSATKNESTRTAPGVCKIGLPVSVLAVGLLVALTGCRTTHQMRSVEESGFLERYTQLQEGVKDQAKLIYINPSANWNQYKQAYIMPVQLWHADDPESSLGKLSEENKELLVSAFYTSLSNFLGKDFQLVDQPGPNVLVVKTAITEAKKSRPVLNVTSSLMPIALAVSTAKRIVFGKHLSVGEVQVEAELLDGGTQERLMAAVDRRAGTKALRTKFDGSLGDCEQAFDYWAERLQMRLSEGRVGIIADNDL